jgi:hypothetical protein
MRTHLVAIALPFVLACAPGCPSVDASTPEARLAESEVALASSCQLTNFGASCLRANHACTQEKAMCRVALNACLAAEERTMGELLVAREPTGERGGRDGRSHFRPSAIAIRQCQLDARACIDRAADDAKCLSTARACVQDAIAPAFESMCADHAAACEGSTDVPCARLAGVCNRGSTACPKTALP